MIDKIYKIKVDPELLPGNAQSTDKTKVYNEMRQRGFSQENAFAIGIELDLKISMYPIYCLGNNHTPACWWFESINNV